MNRSELEASKLLAEAKEQFSKLVTAYERYVDFTQRAGIFYSDGDVIEVEGVQLVVNIDLDKLMSNQVYKQPDCYFTTLDGERWYNYRGINLKSRLPYKNRPETLKLEYL